MAIQPCRLTIIPHTGPSTAAEHTSHVQAIEDGELIARMLLKLEHAELADEMTAQLVSARLGLPMADASRFKSLYRPAEITALRNIDQPYVDFIVVSLHNHQIIEKRRILKAEK